MSDTDIDQKDVFGLPKLSTNAEIGMSFTLFILGMLMVFSTIYSVREVFDVGPALLGMVLIGVSYLFAIEAIRELEEKDHFLSKKLMAD